MTTIANVITHINNIIGTVSIIALNASIVLLTISLICATSNKFQSKHIVIYNIIIGIAGVIAVFLSDMFIFTVALKEVEEIRNVKVLTIVAIITVIFTALAIKAFRKDYGKQKNKG